MIRFDKVQTALFDFVQAATGATASWGYGSPNFDTLPNDFVNMIVSGGPSPGLRPRVHWGVACPPEVVELDVLSPSPLVRVLVRVNRYPYWVDPTPGESATSVRDRLLALIEAGESIPVAASGATGITFSPASPIDLWALSVSDGLDVIDATPGDQGVLVTESGRLITVTFTAYSKGREPYDGAWNLAARLADGFESDALVAALELQNIGIRNIGPAADLSAVDAAQWETRVSMDVTASVLSAHAEAVDTIEEAGLTMVYVDGVTTISAPEAFVSSP